jgi:peptide/nickel transport system permease protein
MLVFILRRIGQMLVTMFVLTFIVFYMVNLPGNLEKVAKTEGNMRMTDEQVAQWLEKEGFNRPTLVRYGEWLGGTLRGDMGWSRVFRKPVNEVIGERLKDTGILMFWVMIVMVPMSLVVGILAGMREGSTLDRSLSVGSIASTSAPEYVTGILFTIIFASWLGWFKGIAKAGDVTFENFTLPVMTMAMYGMGYIARLTRASMVEVMTSQYIRTARLKGLNFRTVVLKHALRNALITPFTVIMLQFPWLLTGVVVVEAMFNYKGFGFALISASGNNDIDLLLAISWVAVIVVLLTQLISDIGYAYLNPRIRVK